MTRVGLHVADITPLRVRRRGISPALSFAIGVVLGVLVALWILR